MRNLPKGIALVLLAATLPTITGCNRSPEFKKDQDYPHDDPYYDRGRTASDKVESMGQPKKKVMVFAYWNDTPVKAPTLGAYGADEMKRGLSVSQRLIVPKDLSTMLTTEDFVSGEKVKVAQLIREGRRLGVAVALIGRITKIVFRQRGDEIGLFRQKQSLAAVDLEIKIFDVAAGREVAALGRSGESSANASVALEEENLESQDFRNEMSRLAIRNAVSAMVPDVVRTIEKMVWQGKIAKISGNKIYVNSGKSSGLVSGDILKVLSAGDDVYDPTSGAYLGRAPGQLKGTLEVIDFIGTDGAVSEIHTGGNFQEGDVVQLY
jgi:curli biogenesis system outer membrane secretion channel CsgG